MRKTVGLLLVTRPGLKVKVLFQLLNRVIHMSTTHPPLSRYP